MELIQATIDIQSPFEEVRLRPIGDIQYGATNQSCSLEALQNFVRQGIQRDAYYIGMGDFVDVLSPSGRRKIASADLYDSAVEALEAAVEGHMEVIKDILRPTTGRWWGLVEGHHFLSFQDGTTADTRFADFLGAPFLGNSALIKVDFREKKKNITASCKIFLHHGVGSGQLTASPLNKLERLAGTIDADIYLMAHQHKLVGGRMSRLQWIETKHGSKLFARQILMACTGGYLRGWTQGSVRNGRAGGGYVEEKMLPPTGIGGVELLLTPTVDDDGFAYVESRVVI